MPWKTEQFSNQVQEPFDNRAFGIEPGFEDTTVIDTLAVPPLHRPRKTPNLQFTKAQCFTDIPQRAAGSIGDHSSCKRRPFPAVFLVDVLNDFFTTFVLEINIDVGRFIAFF